MIENIKKTTVLTKIPDPNSPKDKPAQGKKGQPSLPKTEVLTKLMDQITKSSRELKFDETLELDIQEFVLAPALVEPD
jgi:hypothetical protein